jgi:hypothetical protein
MSAKYVPNKEQREADVQAVCAMFKKHAGTNFDATLFQIAAWELNLLCLEDLKVYEMNFQYGPVGFAMTTLLETMLRRAEAVGWERIID